MRCRFLGLKLRWKDKFRLNNVIWRCWHMQFIKGHRKLVCAFANPLEIDNHNKANCSNIDCCCFSPDHLATARFNC